MASFYIYEWLQGQWIGQPKWHDSNAACFVVRMSSADWFAIYSSSPVQLVGNTILNSPQAYAAMCGGVVMPAGIAVPGWSSSSGLTAPPPQPNPSPAPSPTVPPPPPPPPPPAVTIAVVATVAFVVGVAVVILRRS